MNEHDLLDAIGTAEESMLEASEKRPLLLRKPLLTAAACLLLVISTVISIVSIAGNTAPLPGQTISKEKLTWLRSSNICATNAKSSAMSTDHYAPYYQFFFHISVEARLLEVLPDKYQFPEAHTNAQKYRILWMEVIDPIYVKSMPSRFYYLLPEELSTDLKQFDSLIMIVQQMGCENVMMRNTDRRRMEAFSFLFSSGSYVPHHGSVIACSDGKSDMRLWQLEGWKEGAEWSGPLLDPALCPSYPGKPNRSIQEIKSSILKGAEEYQRLGNFHYRDSVISNADLDWPEAQEVMNYAKPFENGFYGVSYDLNGSRIVTYKRFINGFATNEYISLDLDKREVFRKTTFTSDDLKKLPSLTFALLYARWTKAPKPWNNIEEPYEFCGVKGSYEKHGEYIFGVVEINWGHPDIEESDRHSCCIVKKVRKQTYLLVYPDGEIAEAKNYDAVRNLIAEYTG